MARRELHQPHSAPLKPHMSAGARIRESDGNPHCRQNPSIASLAYPHAGHDTRRNTAARQTQPGAHPHRTLRHTPPHPTKSQYLCNSAESQRYSDPSLNISPPKSDSASLSDSLPDIADERQSGIVGIPRISQSTHLTRPAAKSQYLVQTGVHHELLRHFSKKLSEIKPEREKLRPWHGTPADRPRSDKSAFTIRNISVDSQGTQDNASGTRGQRAHVKRGRSSAAEPRGHHPRESGRAV